MSMRSGSLVALALVGLSVGTAHAAVRAVDHPSQGWSVVVEGDGPGPWTPEPPHAVGLDVLNPAGELRGDGTPALGVRPLVGLPEAVWAAASPRGFDLVHARFDGERWTAPVALTFDVLSQDIHPVIGWDDHGRSMLAWKKVGAEDSVHVAGLSIASLLWGERILEGAGWSPAAIGTDGSGFFVADVNRAMGRLRFQYVAFPFPNGGPALPFPDDSLLTWTAADEDVGADQAGLLGMGGGGPGTGGGPQMDVPATVAASSLQFHRGDDVVWADWVAPDSMVRWVAFRDGQFLDRGAEPYNGPNQIEPARDRIRRTVSGL